MTNLIRLALTGLGSAQTARQALRTVGGMGVAVSIAALMLIGTTGPASAADIEVRDAWAQPVAPGVDAVEVYFTLINQGRMTFVVGVEADIGTAQFCTASDGRCGQIDRMMLAGGDTFIFNRHDIYVQVSGLGRSPSAGDTVSVAILFADDTSATVTALVAELET